MSEKNAGYTEYQERKRKADELMTVKRNTPEVDRTGWIDAPAAAVLY